MMRRLGRSDRWLLAAGGLSLAALVLSFWLQLRAVPAAMRYVPEQSTLWVASAPLREIWEGARPHAARYFAEGGEETPMRSLAKSIREQLQEAKIALEGPDDLPALGIDPSAGLLFAHKLRGPEGVIAVVPVVDRARFLSTVQRWFGAPPQALEGDGPPRLRVGSQFLGFGDDGAAVFTSNPELLREVLERQQAQLDHHRSLDRDAQQFRRLLAGTASPAWLRGRVRDGVVSLPLVGEFHFAIELRPQTLRLQARALLPAGRSAALAHVLSPAPTVAANGRAVLERSDASAILADSAAPDWVRLLSSDAAMRYMGGIEQSFPGLLEQLRSARTLRRISVATLDTRQAVPGLVMGLEVSATDADAIVFGAQAALRLKRDREILRGAQAHLGAGADNAETVLAAGVLKAAPQDPLWPRYRGPAASAAPEPPLRAADFAGPSYAATGADGSVMRYLMPPFTEDDLAWRLPRNQQTPTLRVQDLIAGRYRVCSAYRDGTLWVASDAVELERWLARLRAAPISPDFADAASHLRNVDEAKVLGLALPRSLLAAAELHPDAEVRAERRKWLVDVDDYRALLLALGSESSAGEVHLDVHFVRH